MSINILLLDSRDDIPDGVHHIAEKNGSTMLDNLFGEMYTGFNTACELVTLTRDVIVGYVLVLATIVQEHVYIELYDLSVHPNYTNRNVEHELLQFVTQRYPSLIAYQGVTSQYFYGNIGNMMTTGFAWHEVADKTFSGYDVPPAAVLMYNETPAPVADIGGFINGVDAIINKWLATNDKTLTTYTINGQTRHYITNFFNDEEYGSKGREIGGSFVEDHTPEGRVNLTIIDESKIRVSRPGELCVLKDGSYVGIAFHTHPVFCGTHGGAYVAPPSAGDFHSCFIKHFQGMMKRYFVFSPEGIFFIRINPVFSADLTHKLSREDPHRRNDVIEFLASLAEHTMNTYEQIFFSPDRVYSIDILVGRVLGRLAHHGIEEKIRTTLRSVAATSAERALIDNPGAVLDASDPDYAKKIRVFVSLFTKFFFSFYNKYTSFYELLETYKAFARPNPALKINDCQFLLKKYDVDLYTPVFEIVRANINYHDDTFVREINTK